MADVNDPWARFRAEPTDATADAWAKFRQPPAPASAAAIEPVGALEDSARSVGPGLMSGVDSLAATPGMVVSGLKTVADFVAGQAGNVAAGRPLGSIPPEPATSSPADAASPENVLPKPGSLTGFVEGLFGGKFYAPQTTAGKVTHTVASFIPGAGRNIVTQALLPGLASEAAGAALEGTPLEGPGRAVAAIATGAGGMAVNTARGATPARRAIGGALGELSDEQLAAAQRLAEDAQAAGVPLTGPEAVGKATGNTALLDLQRFVEGSEKGAPIARQALAARPGQVEASTLRELEEFATGSPAPTALGADVQAAARQAVAATPEGQALTDAQFRAGPRVTDEAAGAVIQPELDRVREGRDGMRAALADQDYSAARNAPATVELPQAVRVEGDFPGTVPARPAAPSIEAPVAAPAAPAANLPVEAAGDSLATFIAKNGGLELNGDAAAQGLDRWRIPYAGPVARPGGKSIDGFWREKLADEGYIPRDPDGFVSRDIRDELADLLRREQGGDRQFRLDTGNTRAANARKADLDAVEIERLDRTRGDVIGELEQATGSSRGLDQAAVNKIAERINGGERGLDVLDEYERLVGAGPAPAASAPAAPVPFWEAQRLGQVDASPVVRSIDDALELAKGDRASALRKARATLFDRSGDVEATVAGLQESRDAIGGLVDKAKTAGDAKLSARLLSVRNELDRALETVPEFRQANRNYEAASVPLEPFAKERPLGKVTERDQFNSGFVLPPEKATATIAKGGPSAARDLADVAPRGSEARRAYEGNLTTRILDDATDAGSGNVDAGKLRQALRDRGDELAQFPDVRDRIEHIATAREGLAAVEASPIGKLAQKPDVKAAIDALFPLKPLGEGHVGEVADTMGALARSNPRAARELLRTYVETNFRAATSNLQGGANEFGGAALSKVLVGNKLREQSLEAALRAVYPQDGAARWQGFRRFLDVLEATGMRKAQGSPTAANIKIGEALESGKAIGELAVAAANPVKIPGRLTKAYERFRYGRNTDEMARILFSPNAVGIFRQIVREKPSSGAAQALALRLTYLGNAGGSNASEASKATP